MTENLKKPARNHGSPAVHGAPIASSFAPIAPTDHSSFVAHLESDIMQSLHGVESGARYVGHKAESVGSHLVHGVSVGAHDVESAALYVGHKAESGAQRLKAGALYAGHEVESGFVKSEHGALSLEHAILGSDSKHADSAVKQTSRAVLKATESIKQAKQVDSKNPHVQAAGKHLDKMKDAAKTLSVQTEKVKAKTDAHVKSKHDLHLAEDKAKKSAVLLVHKKLNSTHEGTTGIDNAHKELVKQVNKTKALTITAAKKGVERDNAVVDKVKAHATVLAHSEAISKSVKALHQSTLSSDSASAKHKADAAHTSLLSSTVAVEHNCKFMDNMTILGTLKKMDTVSDGRSCVGLSQTVHDGQKTIGVLRCKPLKSGHCPSKINSECSIAPLEMSKISADSIKHLFS